MKIEQLKLQNGLNTLFVEAPGSNVTTAQVWFKAGSSLENKDNQGIAHFLEHMFFKGSKKYPDMKIAKTVESYGGEINAFTSFDYTCYYINGPADFSLDTVDVLIDMVSNPLFLQEDLGPEREVVFEEYRRSIDNPSQYNFFEMQKASFQNGYKHPILGTEHNIKNFSIKQLQEFREAFYNQENALFVVAGNLSKKNQIIKKLEANKLPNGEISNFPKFKLKDKSTVSIHSKDVNQGTLSIAIQAKDYQHELGAVEDLALNCLGFGDSSPFYKELILKDSIANGVGCSSMFFNNGGCHFMKFTFPVENYSKVLAGIKKSIKTLIEVGLPQDAIDRIRNQYVASKIYEKESIESFAFALGHGFAQTGDIHCENDFIDKMKKASAEQVIASLKDILLRPLHITLQLPKASKNAVKKEQLNQFAKELKQISETSISKVPKINYKKSEFDPEVKIVQIKKGVQLIYRHNSMTPTFVAHAYIKGGLAHEDSKNNGVYNLLGKTIGYGHKFSNYEDLKNELDLKSSYINGFSGRNAYGLTLHGLSEHANFLLENFCHLLNKPTFPAQFFNLEKELVSRTLFIQKEDPVKKCFREFSHLIYHGHPYEMDLIGSESSVKKITRKQVQDLHTKSMNESEIVFTYCGDMDFHSAVAFFKEKFSHLKDRKSSKNKNTKPKPKINTNISFEFDREQTHIMIGKPTHPIGSLEDLYLKMFTTLLSGQSSDLFVEVRDKKGLCYSIQPLQNTALEAGYWGIYIGTGHDKKVEAIKSINAILKRYQKNGLTKSEFNTIKKMIKGQNQLSIQTNDDYANFYSIPLLHDLGIDYQHKSFTMMDNFKHEDVNKFLKSFLDKDWITVEVGRA